jgi:opacity protein-like surface antigen
MLTHKGSGSFINWDKPALDRGRRGEQLFNFGGIAMLRKIFCAVVMFIAVTAFALTPDASAGEQIGVYIAPKFNVGFVNWDAKGSSGVYNSENTTSDSFSIKSNRTDTVVGGTLALGYDFYKKFAVPLRAELEYGIYSGASGNTKSELSMSTLKLPVTANGKIDIDIQNMHTLLANLYIDFHNSSDFTPYIGGGVGFAFIQAEGKSRIEIQHNTQPDNKWIGEETLGSKSQTNFIWQVGVGSSYAFNETVSLDLGYRFISLGSVKTQESHNVYQYISSGSQYNEVSIRGKAADIYMHQVGLGLRITF